MIKHGDHSIDSSAENMKSGIHDGIGGKDVVVDPMLLGSKVIDFGISRNSP